MKKQIILEEEEYNNLVRYSSLWRDYAEKNNKIIKFFIHGSTLEFDYTVGQGAPEEIKVYLDKLKKEIRDNKNYHNEIKIQKLENKLNKIPNWIKSIYI